MNSRNVLKWHIRVFKICGLWPPHGGSILYTIWSIFFTLTVYIGFPISQLAVVFFVDSVNAAVDHLVMTSTIVMAAIKGLNILVQRKNLIKLFGLMKELDETITIEEYNHVFKKKFQESDFLLLLFCVNYIGSWICVGIQVIMSDPGHRLYSSTHLLPNAFLHQQNIYVGGIIFQAISNLFMVFVDIVVDTYGASLLHVLGGHLDVLGQRLRELGKNCSETVHYGQQNKKLIDLYKEYLLIIRFAKSAL